MSVQCLASSLLTNWKSPVLNKLGRCDIDAFKRFYHLMLQEGVYLAPSAYEAGFITGSQRCRYC